MMFQMSGCRKLAVALSFVSVAVLAASGGAKAQGFPNQQIRFVTGFPPGSGADLFTRFIAERMKETSGAQIIVENKPGATGGIALEYVARSKPDGYTVLLTAGSATAAQNHLYKENRVNVIEALRIVGSINRMGFMIAVDPKSPYKSIADLTAAMKLKGDKANYGTSNTSGTILGELYKNFAGLQTARIVYRGTPEAMKELNSGGLDYIAVDPGFALPQQAQGRLRILAVSTKERISSIPDIPTMEEAGVKGINITVWWAVIAPKATPDDIVVKMNGWLNDALSKPVSKKFFNDAGGDIFTSSPAEADALFFREEKAWGEYIRISGIEKQ